MLLWNAKSKVSLFLSNSGSPANPDLYRIDVVIDSPAGVYMPGILKGSINSPHGAYLPGNLKESNPETSKIIASALKHTKPSSSIFDIGDSLNAFLVAQYPKARHVTSEYLPNIKSRLNVKDLSKANCIVKTYIENERYTDTEKLTSFSTEYYVLTSWQFPIPKNSLKKIIYIKIKTTEHLTPSIYDLQSRLIQSRKESNLGQIHPTFDIHQKVVEHTVPFLKEEEETALLRLARLFFDLADEQSPCKRVARVSISMRISTKKTEESSEDKVQVFSSTTIDRVGYEQSQNSKLTEILPNESHRVYIALGSNVGNRIGNIESACQQMHNRGIKVTRTSPLYETKAMYLEDQQSFINGACEVGCAQMRRYSYWTETMIYRLPRLLVQLNYSISSKELRKTLAERRLLTMVLALLTWTYFYMRTRSLKVRGSPYPTSEC